MYDLETHAELSEGLHKNKDMMQASDVPVLAIPSLKTSHRTHDVHSNDGHQIFREGKYGFMDWEKRIK